MPAAAATRPPSARGRRGRRTAAVLTLLAGVLALSGCLGMQGRLTVGADDTVSGTVTVYRTSTSIPGGGQPIPVPTQPNDEPQPAPATTPAAPSSGGSLQLPAPKPTVDTITVAPYAEGDRTGYTYTYDKASFADAAGFAPLADRGGALELSRSGDTVTFTATYDLRYDEGPPAVKNLLAKNTTATVSLTFPGEVGDTNGTLEGRTVTWRLTPLKENTLTATATVPAGTGSGTASPTTGAGPTAGASGSGATEDDTATAASTSWYDKPVLGVPLWVLLASAVGLVVLVLLVVLLLHRRRRRPADDEDSSWVLGSGDTQEREQRPGPDDRPARGVPTGGHPGPPPPSYAGPPPEPQDSGDRTQRIDASRVPPPQPTGRASEDETPGPTVRRTPTEGPSEGRAEAPSEGTRPAFGVLPPQAPGAEPDADADTDAAEGTPGETADEPRSAGTAETSVLPPTPAPAPAPTPDAPRTPAAPGTPSGPAPATATDPTDKTGAAGWPPPAPRWVDPEEQ